MNEQPPLLLIPGLLCDGGLWRNQITGLRDCVNTIIADATRGESIREIAEAMLCNAPERFCLAGFSLGSQIALQITHMARERVRRLALLSATSGGLLPNVKIAIENAISTIEQGNFEQYVENSYVQYVHPSRVGDTVLKSAYIEMARRVGPEAGVRQMRALLSIAGPFTELDQIRCPTVIIGGQQDHRTTPGAHEELAQDIPGSVIFIIENSGHFTPLEQPDAVTNVMRRWLAS
jgi:pimeloyl-ACP methyl ester carboxylesterase